MFDLSRYNSIFIQRGSSFQMEPIPSNTDKQHRGQNTQASYQPNQYHRHIPKPTSNSSPLRSSKTPTRSFCPPNSQEQKSSSSHRLSHKLLRKIKEKESELEMATQKTQLLDKQMQHSFSQKLTYQAVRHAAQNTQANLQAQNQSTTGIPLRNKSSPLRSAAKHFQSVVSQVNINPVTQPSLQSHDFSHPQIVQSPTIKHRQGKGLLHSQRQYADKLTNDNQSLEQRFQNVLNQLQRISNETQCLSDQHNTAYQNNTSIERQLTGGIGGTQPDKAIQLQLVEEKDWNLGLQKSIVDCDKLNIESANQIFQLQETYKIIADEKEYKSMELQQSMMVMKEVESKQAYDHAKISQVELEVEQMAARLTRLTSEVKDGDSHVQGLQSDRDSLMDQIAQVNAQLQVSVSDCNLQKATQQDFTRRSRQYLACKSLSKVLVPPLTRSLQLSFTQFTAYCNFDDKCHKLIHKLATRIEQAGRNKTSLSLKIWFQVTFDPVHIQKQQNALLDQKQVFRLKKAVFSQWQAKFQEVRDGKLKWEYGFGRLMQIGRRHRKLDQIRAFKIWRSELGIGLRRQRALTRLLGRQVDSRRRQALQRWVEYSQSQQALCRQQVFMIGAASDQYKRQILLNLRSATHLVKQKKLRNLAIYFKALKDDISYHKYLMGQSVQLAHLRHQANHSLLKSCLAELRLHKEQSKHQLLDEQLQVVVLPVIDQCQQSIGQISVVRLRQRKLRGMRCLARLANSKVAQYYEKWKQLVGLPQEQNNKLLKVFLKRHNRQQLHQAVAVWKRGIRFGQHLLEKHTQAEMQSFADDLSLKLTSLNTEVESESSRQESHQLRGLTHACKIFNRRVQAFGLHQWRNGCQYLRSIEKNGKKLVDCKRKILCKSAWKIYIEKVHLLQQEDKSKNRADYYLKLREQRLMRTVFNAVRSYVDTFQTSKVYWNIVLTKLDTFLKRKALTKWQNQAHLVQESNARSQQNQASSHFELLNSQLGLKVKTHFQNTSDNFDLHKSLKQQAQRVLSNAFARYYYSKAQRGIKQWRDRVMYEKHREALLSRTLQHQKRWRFYFMKSAFANWISQENVSHEMFKIQHTEVLIGDAKRSNQKQLSARMKQSGGLKVSLAEVSEAKDKYRKRFDAIVSLHVKKNDTNNYQSSLRFIFQQWVGFVRRQKRFIMAITTVVNKSLWKEGFAKLSQVTLDKTDDGTRDKHLVGMRRMFWKKLCGKALSNWRCNMYEAVQSQKIHVDLTRNQVVEEHSTHLTKVSEVNQVRAESIITKTRLANLLQAWKNVTKWLKSSRTATAQFNDSHVQVYQIKRSLKKWHCRNLQTQKARAFILKFKSKQGLLMRQAYFKALKQRYFQNKAFARLLSGIANKLKIKALQDSYIQIKNHAEYSQKAKLAAKEQGSRKFAQVLHQIYQSKMSKYDTNLKKGLQQRMLKMSKVKSMLGYWYARSLRELFMKWRNNSDKIGVEQDVNDNGPVVEDCLTEQIRFQNYQQFMKDQAYTNRQIEKTVEYAKSRAEELLSRAVARLQHNQSSNDQYLKPKMFDRWRQYVKMRKLVKFILRNTENQLAPGGRADLSRAFNLWKFRQSKRLRELNGQDRKLLIAHATTTEEVLCKQDQVGSHLQSQLLNNSLQRDELIDSYVKSQKLAVTLAANNQQRSLHHAVSKMGDFSHKSRQSQLSQILQSNLETIRQLKSKIGTLEGQNQNIARDNEELRQFSLDGFEIAKSAQQLADDRERLSIDLADKARVVRRLLDEHDSFQRDVTFAVSRRDRLRTEQQEHQQRTLRRL